MLSHANIRMPKKGKIYSVNESNFDYWDPTVKNYIRWVKAADEKTGRPLNSRYIGSMMADIHRNLLYGGIFLYPASSKAPEGKLRLMYEANPMAFIVEQAGGRASSGETDILQIIPKKLHQRVPLIIGSEEDVGIALDFINGKRNS